MIVYFADGPLNGQWRDIEYTTRYRVPIHDKPGVIGPGYWEGGGGPWDAASLPQIRVGYYEPIKASLKTGAQIFVFMGYER